MLAGSAAAAAAAAAGKAASAAAAAASGITAIFVLPPLQHCNHAVGHIYVVCQCVAARAETPCSTCSQEPS